MSSSQQEDFVFHEHVCMRWKVNCALEFFAFESPSVTFRNSKLNLRLVKTYGRSTISMSIRCKPPRKLSVEGICEIETFILNQENLKLHCQNRSLMISSPYYAKIWSIDRKLLRSNKDSLAVNDMLHFACLINFSTYRCLGLGKQPYVPQRTKSSSLENLVAGVSRLYRSSEYSDISLKCGNSTIPAHKFLLSARSDVFSAMFKSDMIECQKGVIDIQDIELPVLDHLLKYMYSGTLDDISADTAMQLYRAADKYAVCSLQQKCRFIIAKELTADNACEVLVLADSHADQRLKNQVLSYLQKDRKIFVSDQWRELSKFNPSLAVEAYDMYIRKISPK